MVASRNATVVTRIAAIVARFPRIDQDPDAREAGVRKQAWVPRGAAVLEPVGTAPGLVVAMAHGPIVVVLPGPPRELTGMWPAALASAPVQALLAITIGHSSVEDVVAVELKRGTP